MTVPASAPPTLIVLPDRAEEYLRRLGIPIAAVSEAVQLGDLRSADADLFHPLTARGTLRWIGTVAGLRRNMADGPQWKPRDDRNRPTVERPDGKVTLSVVGCDEATGDPESIAGPRAVNRRGPATIEAVKGQLALFGVATLLAADGGAPPLSIDDNPPFGEWFVLYHRAEDEVRVEVSKPTGIDEQGEDRTTGQFTGWVVRVILDPYRPDPAISDGRPEDVGGDDVDFPIVPAS